jgi:uncharacterized protein (TIGR00369 family)
MIKTYNPAFRNTILEKLKSQTFLNYIGFTFTNIAEGNIEGELILEDYHKQPLGILHGGVTATLADTVAGYAAITLVPQEFNVVTAELKISYLNPGLGPIIRARGWVLKQGKNLNFCEAEVFSINAAGEQLLIAKASAIMATLHPADKN